MRSFGVLFPTGFIAGILAVSAAQAIEPANPGAGAPAAAGALNLSREIRPYPRPPIIVNAAPVLRGENNLAANDVATTARASCRAGETRDEHLKRCTGRRKPSPSQPPG
jgi:hypothetical protein